MRHRISSLWSLISEWQLWLVYMPGMCCFFLSFLSYYLLVSALYLSSEFEGSLASASYGWSRRPPLSVRSDLRIFTLLIIKVFPFYYVSPFFHPLSLWDICIPLFLRKKSNDSNFFSFLSATSRVSASFSGTCESDRRRDEKWKRAVD